MEKGIQGKNQTLVDLIFNYPGEREQEQVLIFLNSKGEEFESFSFLTLKEKCLTVANNVTKLFPPGDVVLLPIEELDDFVISFFGIIMAGCIPAPTPSLRLSGKKIKAELAFQILKQNKVTSIVVPDYQYDQVKELLALQNLKSVKVVNIDELKKENASDKPFPEISSDSVAYIQYTSGSTGSPKGVLLDHDCVLNNINKMCRVFEWKKMQNKIIVCGWIPFYHDMGLVGHLLNILFVNGLGVFMPARSFLSSPAIWLNAINKYKGTSCASPNFALEHVTQNVTPDADLDLSSWKQVFVGSENVSASVLNGFCEKFERYGFECNAFKPVYGLAEATLLVAGGDKGIQELLPLIKDWNPANKLSRKLVPYTLENMDSVKIHNMETSEECKPGMEGEIWVNSPSNFSGYYEDKSDDDTSKTLKTGDLGMIENGHLYITGRIKEMVVMRGVNFYAEDLEIAVKHEQEHLISSDKTVCISNITDSGELFVVFQEVYRHKSEAELESIVQQITTNLYDTFSIKPHLVVMLPQRFIPRTTSFKIARRKCLDSYLSGDLKALYESNKEFREGHNL
ncbi:MAG: AMP-binding protein [Bacteroidetes bacterium]|nr:AMP-binding protein [Bacteroidota bacterium]